MVSHMHNFRLVKVKVLKAVKVVKVERLVKARLRKLHNLDQSKLDFNSQLDVSTVI